MEIEVYTREGFACARVLMSRMCTSSCCITTPFTFASQGRQGERRLICSKQSAWDTSLLITSAMNSSMNNSSLIDAYLWTWTTIDHRVDGWFLMSSVQPMLLLILGYFAMIHYGTKIMKNREPLNVKWLLIIYNVSIALLNLHIVIQFLVAAIRLKYTWYCDVTNSESTDPEEMRMVTALYLYMISKPIEWMDTAFFIVRKRNRQLSTLHVYHHSSIALISWILCRWVPSGSTFVPMLLNSMIHVVMYTYYGLTALGPKVQKYLWWKRYLTIFQMIQFTMALVHGLNGIVTGCRYTRWVQYMVVMYMISFLVLFGLFYRQTYTSGKKSRDECIKASKYGNVAKGQLSDSEKDGLRKRAIVTNF